MVEDKGIKDFKRKELVEWMNQGIKVLEVLMSLLV